MNISFSNSADDLDLSEKKTLLRTKEEELKFLDQGMTVAYAEFCHWKKRLGQLKRRSVLAELVWQLSLRMRGNNSVILSHLKETSKTFEIRWESKLKIHLVVTKEKIVKMLQLYEELRERIRGQEDWKVKLNLAISDKERQLRTLDSLSWFPYRTYGKEMETLKTILSENASDFYKEPKGPLGSLFTVKLVDWVPLVEHILDPYIFIFIADNRHDANKLEEYISQVYGKYPATGFPENMSFLSFDVNPCSRRPDVWIKKFSAKARNFSKTAVIGSSFPTLMDMLDIHDDSPVVRNAIGEFSNFEKVLLFNNEHEAFGEMANHKKIPKNCIIGYTKEFFKVTPSPGFGTTAMTKKIKSMTILKPSTFRTCSQLENQIEGLKLERDQNWDVKLKRDREIQLKTVLLIEKLRQRCGQLKKKLLRLEKNSAFLTTLFDEIFGAEPKLLANHILKGNTNDDYFNKAREAGVAMALIASKQTLLERTISKLANEVLRQEQQHHFDNDNNFDACSPTG